MRLPWVSTRDAEIHVSSGDTVCFNVLVLLSRVRVVMAIPQSVSLSIATAGNLFGWKPKIVLLTHL
jgi:hypothetical protein